MQEDHYTYSNLNQFSPQWNQQQHPTMAAS